MPFLQRLDSGRAKPTAVSTETFAIRKKERCLEGDPAHDAVKRNPPEETS
jgi:hypothetical protein